MIISLMEMDGRAILKIKSKHGELKFKMKNLKFQEPK